MDWFFFYKRICSQHTFNAHCALRIQTAKAVRPEQIRLLKKLSAAESFHEMLLMTGFPVQSPDCAKAHRPEESHENKEQ